jgi:hypothetical protein
MSLLLEPPALLAAVNHVPVLTKDPRGILLLSMRRSRTVRIYRKAYFADHSQICRLYL